MGRLIREPPAALIDRAASPEQPPLVPVVTAVIPINAELAVVDVRSAPPLNLPLVSAPEFEAQMKAAYPIPSMIQYEEQEKHYIITPDPSVAYSFLIEFNETAFQITEVLGHYCAQTGTIIMTTRSYNVRCEPENRSVHVQACIDRLNKTQPNLSV